MALSAVKYLLIWVQENCFGILAQSFVGILYIEGGNYDLRLMVRYIGTVLKLRRISMKRLWLLCVFAVVICLIIGAVAGCSGTSPSATPTITATQTVTPETKPIRWKYAAYCPEGILVSKSANWVLDEIERRSNGRIKFDRYFGGSPVSTTDDIRMVKAGVIQMAQTGPMNHTI